MPLFGRRRAAKSARKWHESVAATAGESRPSPTTNLQGHEFHHFPYAQLSIFTKEFLGKKKRSEAEQDQILIDLIQHDDCKEVAFAACLEFLSLDAAQSLRDDSFHVVSNTSYSLESYLQAFVAVAHCNPSQGLDLDKSFAQSLLPAVHAVSNHGINPAIARELLSAWSINEPSNRLLKVRVTTFTKHLFQQIDSELTQFQQSLIQGTVNRRALDRAFEYSNAFAARGEPDNTISSSVTNWRSWATWAPNIWRLRAWAALPRIPRDSAFQCLMELDGPDFNVDEPRSNKCSSLMHKGQLLQWLESERFTLGLGLITGDSTDLLAEFIHTFIDCAQSSLRKGKSDFLRYLITKHGLDSQALRCWQVADSLLDPAFVALLLRQDGSCHRSSDDDKALIGGLKALARDITQAVREPLGRDIAAIARTCVDDLLATIQRCATTGEDWIEAAMRLWALRNSIATSGWLHTALDSTLVFRCTSQSPLHGLNTLHALQYGIEKVIDRSQTTLKSCFDIYVQAFLFTGVSVDDETTAVPYVLHRTWMRVQRDTVRELAIQIGCSEQLDTRYRISCIRRISNVSEDDLSVLQQSFVSLPQGNVLAIMSLLVVIDALQTSASQDPCWRELFIYLTRNADIRIDHEDFTGLGYPAYKKFLETLYDLVGNEIKLVQSTHQWLEELRSVEAGLATIEADSDSSPAMHCVLAEQKPEIRTRYLKMLKCSMEQHDPERKLLLHELILALRSSNSAHVCHAVMAISKVESRGFVQCKELLMTCRKDRNVASVRLSFWLKNGGLSDAAEAALTSLGMILNLGIDHDLNPPSSSFDAAKKEYAKRVAELVARAQQLEKIQRSLRRRDADSINAMIAALGLEPPLSGIATLAAEIPTTLTHVVKEVSDDEVELHFPLSRELTPLNHLAFGLKGTETLTVHLEINEHGKFGCFCVHLHDRAVKSIQNHNYYNSATAPDRLYCGNERLTRLTYAVSRSLWTAASQQGETSLQEIYEGIRTLIQAGTNRCMVCGRIVGVQLHRGTICDDAKCVQALRKTPLDFRLQDVRTNGRVVDLLLTSVFAAANVSNLGLLPGCPATLNDAAKLQILLNSLPPTATLAAAKDFQTGLQGCGLRAQLLMSWLCTSYRGFIVPATGSYQLPNIPRIHQFLVVNNTPEIEAAFSVHNNQQPRHVLFHGTSLDRLYAILVQGLKICSHTPLQKHGAVHGAGIYTGREPKTALGYATATQTNANFNGFFNCRADLRDSTVMLGLEHAGNHGGTGGVHLITDPTRIMLRYIFIIPSNTPVPNASAIVPAMLTSFQSLKAPAASRAAGTDGTLQRTGRCSFMQTINE